MKSTAFIVLLPALALAQDSATENNDNIGDQIIQGIGEGVGKVTSGAVNAFDKVTSGAVNGYEKVTSGAVHGYDKVTSGADSLGDRVKSDFDAGKSNDESSGSTKPTGSVEESSGTHSSTHSETSSEKSSDSSSDSSSADKLSTGVAAIALVAIAHLF